MVNKYTSGCPNCFQRTENLRHRGLVRAMNWGQGCGQGTVSSAVGRELGAVLSAVRRCQELLGLWAAAIIGTLLLEEPDPNKPGKPWEPHARFLPSATGCQPDWFSSCSLLVASLDLAKLLKPHFLSCSAQPSVQFPIHRSSCPQPHLGLEPWDFTGPVLRKKKAAPSNTSAKLFATEHPLDLSCSFA